MQLPLLVYSQHTGLDQYPAHNTDRLHVTGKLWTLKATMHTEEHKDKSSSCDRAELFVAG